MGRVTPLPAHPAGLGGFLSPSSLKTWTTFLLCSGGPGLAWCMDGFGGILRVARPPVRCLPRLSPVCHLTSLFSLLATVLHVALSCPYLTISPHRDFLGVSKPLH